MTTKAERVAVWRGDGMFRGLEETSTRKLHLPKYNTKCEKGNNNNNNIKKGVKRRKNSESFQPVLEFTSRI